MQLATQNELLLVAARKRTCGHSLVPGTDVELSDNVSRRAGDIAPGNQSSPIACSVQRKVLGQRHLENQRVPMPVIRDKPNVAREIQRSRGNWCPPGDCAQQLPVSRPLDRGYADNLAALDPERRASYSCDSLRVGDLDIACHDNSCPVGPPRGISCDHTRVSLAEHGINELVFVNAGAWLCQSCPPTPQH